LTSYVRMARGKVHECNLCGYKGRFRPFGDPPRPGARCARCGAMERHRLVGMWVEKNPQTDERARLLHFAPEAVLKRLFRDKAAEYRSGDLTPGAADLVVNIEAIDLPDESIDLVICSHVLEHVDDHKALREIYRILVPGGQALLMFPIVEGWDRTYEDDRVQSHGERTLHFGQWDHVRMFGRDVRDRIKAEGFELSELTAEEPEVSRYGLVRGEKLFVAVKAL
jgi:SAM-dependent methyltransferase